MKKKYYLIISLILIIILIIIFFLCNKKEKVIVDIPNEIEYIIEDEDYTIDDNATLITLEDNNIVTENQEITINNNQVTIKESGTYILEGKLSDGNIIVDADKKNVKLILRNINITSTTSAPIYIKDAKKVIITIEENTTSTLTDGNQYTLNEDEEPNSTIFSKSDLVINGSGNLIINANYNNGITSKDSLKIIDTNIKVNSINHGIKGKDYLEIKNTNLNINSGGDGLKSDNEEDNLGYITIENSTLDITSKGDAIDAFSKLSIISGNYTIKSGSGIINNDSDSMKGIKANNIIIDDGEFNITSADDSIHANDTITINNGNFLISSDDDGIHADNILTINNGSINLTKSYEGIESTNLIINNGNININASDDGINAAGGTDTTNTTRPGRGNFSNSTGSLTINGGKIVVNAKGDGLDANGNIIVNDGEIIVYGPTDNGNGALDYDGSFNIKKGTLIITGSSGMAQAPSNSSTQYSLMYNFSNTNAASSTIKITDQNNNIILETSPIKNYQSLVYSSDKLKLNETYNIYINEKLVDTITLNSITTSNSNFSNQPRR